MLSGSEMGFREDCGGSRGVGREGWCGVGGGRGVAVMESVGNGKTGCLKGSRADSE